MNSETRRQLIGVCLALAGLLFVLGVAAMMNRMVVAAICWGLASLLMIASIVLYAQVVAQESLTGRRRRG